MGRRVRRQILLVECPGRSGDVWAQCERMKGQSGDNRAPWTSQNRSHNGELDPARSHSSLKLHVLVAVHLRWLQEGRLTFRMVRVTIGRLTAR